MCGVNIVGLFFGVIDFVVFYVLLVWRNGVVVGRRVDLLLGWGVCIDMFFGR